MAAAAFDPHASYEERSVNPDRLAAIRRHAGPRILDVGCGSGAYVRLLGDDHETFGFDHEPFATWQGRESFAVGDASKPPIRPGAFDTVLVFETLEHLPDPLDALRRYHDVCTKNVIVTVPNCAITDGMRRSNLIYHHWIDPTHRHFFDLDSISALVERAGFAVEERTLVNRINLGPLFAEAAPLGSRVGSLAGRVLQRLSHPYFMTCLVVGRR